MRFVDGDELLLVGRDLVAGAAVDALAGIDVHLGDRRHAHVIIAAPPKTLRCAQRKLVSRGAVTFMVVAL